VALHTRFQHQYPGYILSATEFMGARVCSAQVIKKSEDKINILSICPSSSLVKEEAAKDLSNSNAPSTSATLSQASTPRKKSEIERDASRFLVGSPSRRNLAEKVAREFLIPLLRKYGSLILQEGVSATLSSYRPEKFA